MPAKTTEASTKPAAPTASATGAKTLTLERVFHATSERLWTYWTEPKKYAKWIYPGKTDVAMHQFEAKIGGKVSFHMLLDTGEDMLNEGVFHLLDKPHRIEAGSPDKSFLLVATFEPVGKEETRLRVTVEGVPADWHEQARQGWNSCLDKLGRQLDAPGVSGPARGLAKGQYVEVTRWFNAPPARVYGAWTDPKVLPNFFWPVGQGVVKQLEARPGGRLVMGHATHADWTATWEFLELLPGRKIVIKDIWPDGSGHEATGTMEFTAENGGTRMQVRFGPFPGTGPFRPEDAASGSAMVADRLAEQVETPGAGEGFQVVRYFEASPERVYAMWTRKESLAKWWGPSAKAIGYDFQVNHLDVRVGGTYDIVMSNAQHGELHNHGVYTEVVPNRRLSQRWEFDIFLAPGEKPYAIAITIDFEPTPTMEGKTGTKMTFTQGPMAKPDFTEGSRQGVIQNLGYMAKALEA